jgi:O-antigen/teichoic acid export membrane protein
MQLKKLLYKNIFWRGLNMASVFVLNIFIAQVFGAALYGQLFFFINSLSFALLVVSFSLDSGFTFYGAKNELNSSAAVVIAFLWSIVGALLVWVFYTFFGTTNENGLQSFMYVTGMLLLTFFTALFSAKFNYVIPNCIVAIVNIILCLLVFIYNQNFEEFVQYFFLAILVQGCIIGIAYLFIYIKHFKFSLPNKVELNNLMRYSGLAFISNVLFFLVYRVDYWMVNYFVKDDAAQLGNYIQVSKVGQLFIVVPSIIASTVFAITAEGKKENMASKVQKVSKQIFAFVFVSCIPLVLFGKWVFPFVFGKTFIFMYMPFLWLLPGIVALAIQSPYSAFNAGVNRQKINLFATIIALLIIIVGDLVLIPILGINGAAIASSIGYCTCTLYLLYNYKKTKLYTQI